jgi:hypothetical protein
LICEICGKEFQRITTEAKRNEKLGRRIYCSLKCVGKSNIRNIPVEKRYHPQNLRRGYWTDEYSPFRGHLNRARSHAKNKRECNISLLDLKKQWEKQKGICPYTGWAMENKMQTSAKLKKSPTMASVDRIDSSKGYTPDNIQFVCFIANIAKHDFSENDFLNFCEAVVKNVIVQNHFPEESHD